MKIYAFLLWSFVFCGGVALADSTPSVHAGKKKFPQTERTEATGEQVYFTYDPDSGEFTKWDSEAEPLPEIVFYGSVDCSKPEGCKAQGKWQRQTQKNGKTLRSDLDPDKDPYITAYGNRYVLFSDAGKQEWIPAPCGRCQKCEAEKRKLEQAKEKVD